MDTTRDLVEHAFEVYNSGDVDAFADLYAEDAVLNFPDEAVRGRDAIRRNWAEQRAGFPDSHIHSDLLVVEGDTVADEFTFTGTNTEPMPMPDGTTMAPTGRHIEMKGMQLMQMRDGKMVRHDIFLDTSVWLTQMGLASSGL